VNLFTFPFENSFWWICWNPLKNEWFINRNWAHLLLQCILALVEMLLVHPVCTACLLPDAKCRQSPPMNVKRRVGQSERLFNFHCLAQSVVGHWETIISCKDTVISSYSRSRRALLTGALFQVPSSFSVFLQIKLGRAGGWGRGVFWILSVDLYELILTRNTYSMNLEGPPLTYRSLSSVCATAAFPCVEFPVPPSLRATSWLFFLC
jgi:hypothetical protein